MLKLPNVKIDVSLYEITVLLLLIIIAIFALLYVQETSQHKTTVTQVSALSKNLQTKQEAIASLQNQIKKVNKNYVNLQSTDLSKQEATLQAQLDSVNNAFNTYTSLQKQISDAKNLGLNTDIFTTQLAAISQLLLSQDYSDAISSGNTLNTNITNAVNAYKAQKAAAEAAAPPANLPGSSFNITTISAQGKQYTVYYVSIDLTSPNLKIITDTADSSDCTNNCNLLDLMTYYNRDHGFAAINGSYFCPASYSNCAGLTNSYDYPFYNSNLKKWINQGDLSWINRSIFTFDGSAQFYGDGTTYLGSNATPPAVNAGFAMAPGLLHNGQVIVNNFPLDTKSSTVAATRGAFGLKGNNLIIADAFGCTVPQMAYIMQAMGATEAINLDGGGSTAMIYNGKYVLGPGRAIPNAIIFARG